MYNYTAQSFDYAAMPMPERIAAARKLLAEAGFTREKPLRFELRYNTGEVHAKVAVAVASMWKETLGVEAQLVAVEFKSLIDDIDRRNIDMYRMSWIGDYNDPYTFLQERLRYQSAALLELCLRRAARRRFPASRCCQAPYAARTGRAPDARGSPDDSALFLREQAPGEARAQGLVRQRHERRLFTGPRARSAYLIACHKARTLRRSTPAISDKPMRARP
jgi:hypothetical protein